MNKQMMVLCLSVIVLISCDQSKSARRNYQEISIKPPEVKMDNDFAKKHPFLNDQMSSPDLTSSQMPSGQSDMLKASVANVDLSWSVPQGWNEEPGSGMRLVTFKNISDPDLESSIVSLAGVAGGLNANVIRWLKQINLPDLSEEELAEFISSQEEVTLEGKQTLKIINFTDLQKQDDEQTQSMVASILQIEDKTVFIKMTGPKKSILSNLDKFKSLCQSLKIKP